MAGACTPLLLAPLLAAAALAGCGEGDAGSGGGEPVDPRPEAAIASAARESLEEPLSELTIQVNSEEDRWAGEGAIDLSGGRFRLAATLATPESGDGEPPELVVLGTEGEGFENTVRETTRGLGPSSEEPQACWFNPHEPVGFFAEPLSVEEATRLTGSIVESLAEEEIAQVDPLDDGGFEVELRSSAAEPKDDFKDRPERVWGDRYLVKQLMGPVKVSVVDGRLSQIELELRHEPDFDFRPLGEQPGSRDVRVSATLSPSDEELEIEQPPCLAME